MRKKNLCELKLRRSPDVFSLVPKEVLAGLVQIFIFPRERKSKHKYYYKFKKKERDDCYASGCSSFEYFCVLYENESCIFGYEGGFKKKE